MAKQKDLNSVLNRLNKNNSVNIKGKTIEYNNTTGKVGNGTLGDIDFLVKTQGYSAIGGEKF